jgi:F-type H+-transporting ATPase subunit b
MDIFLQLANGASLLASEATEAGGGFGFNFNIIEANLVNLAIVIGVLVYFLRGFLTKNLGERSATIETALTEAERKRAETAKLLAAEQEKLKQAKTEAAQILGKAAADSQRAKDAILAAAQEEIVRMRETAAADLGNEQTRILNELRVRVAELAIQRAETELPSQLGGDRPQRLVDRSIAMLGGQ